MGGRPTTSRHVPNPSPDKFHDYVVPSPTKDEPLASQVWDFASSLEYESEGHVDTDTDPLPSTRSTALPLPPPPPPPLPPPRGEPSRLSASAPSWAPEQDSDEDKDNAGFPWYTTTGEPSPEQGTLAEMGRWLLGVGLTA